MRVELRGVSKFYGTRTVLDRVTFDVPEGEIGVLLGPDGAGKTTLLRCLATVLLPDEGTLRCDGIAMRRDDLELRRRLHFLPDVPVAFATDTVLDALALFVETYGIDGDAVGQRAVSLLEAFGILSLIDTPCSMLSRGESYKVALCAMLLVDPELWLLDEPFASGMDPQGLDAFRHCARAALREGRTIIYSTQIVEIAETFGDWFGILEDGELRVLRRDQLGSSSLSKIIRGKGSAVH